MTRVPGRPEGGLRQRKPFATPQQEALIALLRTADVMRRRLGSVVEPRGITPQQYNVLRILRGAGEEGMPTLEIGRRMIERTPGVTRLLDRLEAKGLARRERCPSDRRQVLCWIARPGLELLEALDGPVALAEREAMRALPARDLGELVRLLDVARGGVD